MIRGTSAYKIRNKGKEAPSPEVDLTEKYKCLFSKSAERMPNFHSKNLNVQKSQKSNVENRDLRQIMYEANALLRIANDELIQIGQKSSEKKDKSLKDLKHSK